MHERFPTLLIKDDNGRTSGRIETMSAEELPDHDVLVEVEYSSLNYKDGLAVSGCGKIARRLPMVGGIDLAGNVVESRNPAWRAGDAVVVNGWGLSETHWGGYARYARLKPEWLIRRPEAFTSLQAMAIGTAGYTAALCVDALERWGAIAPGEGEILVTGAAGGVGSVAIALLARAGYKVTASTGRPESEAYLQSLGATALIDRNELSTAAGPLQKERWRGAVDAVGSVTLANVLAQTCYGGGVAACGLAGGADLPASVLPHILRGVALLGVDSVMAPIHLRKAAWARLARDLDPAKLSEITAVEPMSELPRLAADIVAGKIRGRVAIDVRR